MFLRFIQFLHVSLIYAFNYWVIFIVWLCHNFIIFSPTEEHLLNLFPSFHFLPIFVLIMFMVYNSNCISLIFPHSVTISAFLLLRSSFLLNVDFCYIFLTHLNWPLLFSSFNTFKNKLIFSDIPFYFHNTLWYVSLCFTY